MQEKDKVSNRYLEDAARFADIVNVQLYDGEQVLGAENIKERKNTNRYLKRNAKGFHSYTVERDIVREAKLESHVVLIAVKNQSGIHYAMPARVMQEMQLIY